MSESSDIEQPIPTFGGYLLVRHKDYLARWRTRYFKVHGNQLSRFVSNDAKNPTQTIQLSASTVMSTNDKKMTIKIKQGSRKLTLKARDRNDFECWSLVLQRAKLYKGTRTETYLNISKDGRVESVDFGSDDDGSLSESCEDTTKITDQKREALFKKFMEMKSLEEKLALQPPFMISEDQSKKKKPETDAQRFLLVSKEALSLSVGYIARIENERDVWKQKLLTSQEDKKELEKSFKLLAKQHHLLETQTTYVLSNNELSVPPELPKAPTESMESDDEADVFFDAVEDHRSIYSARSVDSLKSKSKIKSKEKSLRRNQRKDSKNKSIGKSDSGFSIDRKSPEKSSAVEVFHRRTQLPAPSPKSRPGVWAVLKNNIGKDLSRISIPIVFNEPLSALQKWAEDLEYSHLLDYAATTTDPLERLAYVATFHISHYSDTMNRLYKPFNPILGETYEFVRNDLGKGVRFFAEQVSHHPPVSACHSIGNGGWQYYTCVGLKNSFKGKDLEVYPQGTSHIVFENGEHITYKRVTTCVRNIIVGSMWYGESTFTNHKTGDTCVVNYKPYSYFSGNLAEVTGKVMDKHGKVHFLLKGKWDSGMTLEPADHSKPAQEIWTRNPLPANSSQQYEFTHFTITLNEIDPESQKAAPTDSRKRGDLRLYEEGKVDEAQAEKERLEETQRARRRLLEASGKEYEAQFFKAEYDKDVDEEVWKFTGTYWKKRENQEWDDSPDLYS